jgi:hypothetical protein
LDSFEPNLDRKKHRLMRGGEIYDLKDRSLVVLRLPIGEGEDKNGDFRSVPRRSRREAGSAANA